MGTGIDRIYPAEHEPLARRIVSSGQGALVSQFWPTSPPTRYSFPMRNVVMSGMGVGTVVIEASRTSGAKLQARYALDHEKRLFLVKSLVLREEWAQKAAGHPLTTARVCRICHGAVGRDAVGAFYSECASCLRSVRQVAHGLGLVVPISLYEYGPLHQVLRGYKGGTPEARSQFVPRVAALLGRFLREHKDCIAEAAGRDYDTVTIIPSTREGGRPDGHPLEAAIKLVPWVSPYLPLLRRGDMPIGHRSAEDDGYEPLPDARGRSVLLVDDTFTSGARLQSAASALTRGGAAVVAAVVIGRIVHPDFADNRALVGRSALVGIQLRAVLPLRRHLVVDDRSCVGRHGGSALGFRVSLRERCPGVGAGWVRLAM
jgi:DNA recombination-mediator protein A